MAFGRMTSNIRPDSEIIEAVKIACKEGDVDFIYSILHLRPDLKRAHKLTYLLHDAASKGQDHIVKMLIQMGYDVNYNPTWHDGRVDYGTPLHYAVKKSHPTTARILINAGAHVEELDDGYAALHAVTTLSMAQLLMEHGANVNARCQERSSEASNIGSTVLHSMVINHDVSVELLNYIIKQVSDVNATDICGSSPLHYLVNYTNTKKIPTPVFLARLNILVNAGVNLFQQNNNKRNALTYHQYEMARNPSQKWQDPRFLEKAMNDYSQIRKASIMLRLCRRTSELFNSLPTDILSRIATLTAESDVLDERSKSTIANRHIL